jgi:hypothetical protein
MRRSRFVSLWIAVVLLTWTLLPVPITALDAAADDAEQIAALLDQMEAAVRAGDRAAYLACVDQSDPVFALEHTRWADDWADLHPVERFDLMVRDLQIDGDEATADLTMLWSLKDNPASRRARYPVWFRRGEDGAWRYAGEVWITIETAHFRVRAAPGLEDTAAGVVDMLPEVYDHATASLGYTPTGTNEIKLYASAESLVANTLLSLPRISGWNEPGEALKLLAEQGRTSAQRLKFVLAHEFTHKLTFDMAGDSHGNFPWWLEEGIAQYVGFAFMPEGTGDDTLAEVQGWQANGELVSWDQISDFAVTPLELWRYVYPQGYALVRYVTEKYGEQMRNAWLRRMAVEATLSEATQQVFGVSFVQLDRDFRAWLVAARTAGVG